MKFSFFGLGKDDGDCLGRYVFPTCGTHIDGLFWRGGYHREADTVGTVILLHGIGADSSFFTDEYYKVVGEKRSVFAPDLLGFGKSPWPCDCTYTRKEHVDALCNALKAAKMKPPFTIVGHSLGGIIGLALAKRLASNVENVITFSTPLYEDEIHARQCLVEGGWISRICALHPRIAGTACVLMCGGKHWPGHYLFPLAVPDFPRSVVESSVLHTWHSYSSTLENIILHPENPSRLFDNRVSYECVIGKDDRLVDIPYVQKNCAGKGNVTVTLIEGDHHIPLKEADECLAIIMKYLG